MQTLWKSAAQHGERRFAAAGLVATMLVCAGCSGSGGPQDRKLPIPKVRVVPARLAKVSVQVPVVGTVMPSETSDVAAGSAGKVVEFPFREGQFVRQGESLAKLESKTLEIEIQKAKALLRQQEEIHRELTGGYRNEEKAASLARMLAAGADHQRSLARRERLDSIRERSPWPSPTRNMTKPTSRKSGLVRRTRKRKRITR